MARPILTNENWSKLQPILLAEVIYDQSGLRMTAEGMLYRMRTGCPWRDLPDVFGPWNAIYKRFGAWCQSGKWQRVFEALSSTAISSLPEPLSGQLEPVWVGQTAEHRPVSL